MEGPTPLKGTVHQRIILFLLLFPSNNYFNSHPRICVGMHLSLSLRSGTIYLSLRIFPRYSKIQFDPVMEAKQEVQRKLRQIISDSTVAATISDVGTPIG